MVQLESVVLIPSSINERHSERTQTYSSFFGIVGIDGIDGMIGVNGLIELARFLNHLQTAIEREIDIKVTSVLSVSLLEVTKFLHELFAGHVFVVGIEVLLCGSLYVVDQDVGVRSKTGNSADHVAIRWIDIRGYWLDHFGSMLMVYVDHSVVSYNDQLVAQMYNTSNVIFCARS